ncbi:hypothetical protein BGZ72_008612, partial [Mortierella alpina]
APAIELETLMILKAFIRERRLAPAAVEEVYLKFVFCRVRPTYDSDMARMDQQYCQVARARWCLAFVLGAAVFGELALSYWARDFKVQQKRDGTLQDDTGKYKTMADSDV